MKNTLIPIIGLLSILSSCGDKTKSIINDIEPIELSSSSTEAIEFFRKAEKLKFDQDYIKANSAYKSALELDPNFVMALTEINESDISLAKIYRKKALENFANLNAYEKLAFEWDTLPNSGNWRSKKIEISKRIIELYPDKIEGYINLAQSYAASNDSDEKLQVLDRAIELDPLNSIPYVLKLTALFSNSSKSIPLQKNPEFFKKFQILSDQMLELFPDNIRVITSIADIYSNSYDYFDQTRIDKSISLFNKALDLSNKIKSSNKARILSRFSRVYISSGVTDKGIDLIKEGIRLSENSGQTIERYFNLFKGLIYSGKLIDAISEIDKFESNLNNLSLSELELLKCSVGINLFKAVIFAHSNNKKRAFSSFESYVSASSKLINFLGFKKNITDQLSSYPGSNSTRFRDAGPMQILVNEIWINILVGEHANASNLLSEMKSKYSNEPKHWIGLLKVMQGETENALEILNPIRFGYFQYFKAQAQLNLGEKEKATQLLDSVRRLPNGNFYNNFIIKRADDLLKNI